VTPPDAHAPEANGLTERLRSELEQAYVAIEDMSERVAELVRANEELTAQLQEEVRLREQTEKQLLELRSGQPEDPTLRQELSVALEELQVMQEELQAAHDALAVAAPRPG
jgi:predicted RNase H-like nuclease (RuvC/YqgF family)